MHRLSLKVLLRFLSTYSHWNLVRRSESYHLYFVTKNCESSRISLSNTRRHHHRQRNRRVSSKLHKTPVPTVRRAKQRSVDGASGKGKDVLIFSPIFETVEEAVQVGIVEPGDKENSIYDEKSKRSSYDSLAWDDFLPYKSDGNQEDDSCAATLENSTEFDSKESTPFYLDDFPTEFEVVDDEEPHNVNVRNQADKLLKDMLQLRKEIEEMNCQPNELEDQLVKRITSNLVEKDDEKNLYDRLETMTEEMKKEFDAKGAKGLSTEPLKGSKSDNIDDDTKIRNFFKNITEKKQNIIKPASATAAVGNTPQTEAAAMEPKEKAKPAVNGSLEEEAKPAKRKAQKESKPTRGEIKERKKRESSSEADVPFCEYNLYKTGKNVKFASLERRKKKKENPQATQPILSADDKIAAKDILNDLKKLRDKNLHKNGEKNQVLESVISIISLSSTNMTLPVPTQNSVLFKDLLDFEVNFCESREVFEKLAMNGSEESHSLQDLFPWSDQDGCNRLKL